MSTYALLLAPSANRVYADAATRLTQAELAAFAESGVLDATLCDIAEARIGGVPYVTFRASAPRGDSEASIVASASERGAQPSAQPRHSELPDGDIAYLSNLSAAYALFALVEGELLRPVAMRPLAHYDDDLITIPKYAGKTNEQFTRLLLNVTLLASAAAPHLLDRRLVVLDPLCGRGTTLNQALMYGYDGIGVELDGKDVDAYAAFLRTWLKRKRLKHTAEMVPVRRDRRLVARRFEAELAPTKDDYRAGATQRITVLHADTTQAREFLRAGCADVIVADAPYGVAHGSRTRETGLSRGPLALLAAAVPGWVEMLRPGGALGLAWNVHAADRAEAARALAAAGLEPVDTPAYRGFGHWVDQAITRDILVARKPA